MGEIADMMLDGTLCQVCGGIMDDMSPSDEELAAAPRDKDDLPIIHREAPGFPRTCASCKEDERPRWGRKAKKRKSRKEE